MQPSSPSLDRRYLLAIAGGVGLASALGLLILSTRFSIATPSLIDDWMSARQAQKSFGDLLHPFFHVLGYRYRPTWDLSSYLEWNTLGAPRDLFGPNLWGIARMLLFVAGTILVPAVIAATSSPRPKPLELGALCAAAGILIFSGPWTDVDFFRLGPQEQVMVGAISCGVALLFYGAGRAISCSGERRTTGKTALLCLILVGGWLLWAFGIYHKEASVVVVVLAPFIYLFLDRRWRERGVIERALWRYRAFQLSVLAMLLPLIHDAIMVASVSGEGIAEYGAEPPHGLEYFPRSIDAFSFLWNGMETSVGSPVWTIATILTMAAIAVVIVRQRKRMPWLVLGLVVTGWAVFVLQGLPMQHESRYYLPPMALFVAGALLALAQGPRWLRLGAIVGALVIAVANADAVKSTLDLWSAREKDEAEAVRLIADLHPETCPIYMGNLDIERAEALPNVLPFIGKRLSGPCRTDAGTIVVGLKEPWFPADVLWSTRPMRHICATDPKVLAETDAWSITGCPKLNPRVNGQPVKNVLRRNQVVPFVGPILLRRICTERYGPIPCGRKRAPAD